MSRDEIQAAYDRISGRFPAECPVEIMAQAHVGRRTRPCRAIHPHKYVYGVDTLDYSLHVTAGGVDYVEIDVDLDEIESAAEAIIEKIAAANMADPAKSRRGLDRLAADINDPIKVIERRGLELVNRALSPASGGTGRAA